MKQRINSKTKTVSVAMEQTIFEAQLRKFCDFFLEYRSKYVNFALRFVHDPAVVEDLVNDSITSFWEKREDIAPNINIEAYFYTIIKNKCLNWLRSKEIECRVQNEMAGASYRLLQYEITALEKYDPNRIFANEIWDILQEELSKMPAITRKVFADSRFNNMNYNEIAKKHNISIWKVAREIQAAITTLRSSLQDYLPAGFFVFNL